MRLIYDKDLAVLTRKIACEIINISSNTTYFDSNCGLVKQPKSPHNKYIIKGVEYQINPPYGIVHFGGITYILNDLRTVISELSNIILKTFGHRPTYNIAFCETTQYTSLTPKNAKTTIEFTSFEAGIVSNYYVKSDSFIWYYSTHLPRMCDLHRGSFHINSLYSIVASGKPDVYKLPTGFFSPNYLSLKDFSFYDQSKVFPRVINISASSGIYGELLKSLTNREIDMCNGKKYKENKYKVYLVPWNALSVYSVNDDTYNYVQHIERGILDTEPNEEIIYRCFISGLPIFDDCYVIDVQEREVTEIINRKNLPKYPKDAIIVTPEMEKKEKEAKKKKKKQPRRRNRRNDDDGDGNDRDDDRGDNRDEDDGKGDTNGNNEEKKEITPVKQKVTKIKRGGQKVIVDQIKIRYRQVYQKPRCLLISPYLLHYYDSTINILDEFAEKTRSKFLLYRSRCPVTASQLIESSSHLNATEKKILDAMYYDCIITSSSIKYSMSDNGSNNKAPPPPLPLLPQINPVVANSDTDSDKESDPGNDTGTKVEIPTDVSKVNTEGESTASAKNASDVNFVELSFLTNIEESRLLSMNLRDKLLCIYRY
jgi:hypothetical protein